MTKYVQGSLSLDSSDDKSDLGVLKLKQPLVFFDLETTGLDFDHDRIIQFAFLKVLPDHSTLQWTGLVNPGIPIPTEASQVHNISDAMVKDKPSFCHYAPDIVEYVKDCDLAGFNIARFDIPFLQTELKRCGYGLNLDDTAIVDVKIIYHKKEPRDLAAACRFYCQKEHIDAHDAMGDVKATLDVFLAQMQTYSDLKTIENISRFCKATDSRWLTPDKKFYWRNGVAVMAFGKHRGKELEWVASHQRDYLQWLRDRDISDVAKRIVDAALRGIYPQKENQQSQKDNNSL